MVPTETGARLLKALDDVGFSQNKLQTALGMESGYVSRLVKKLSPSTSLRIEWQLGIVKLTGKRAEWLWTGEGPEADEATAALTPRERARQAAVLFGYPARAVAEALDELTDARLAGMTPGSIFWHIHDAVERARVASGVAAKDRRKAADRAEAEAKAERKRARENRKRQAAAADAHAELDALRKKKVGDVDRAPPKSKRKVAGDE